MDTIPIPAGYIYKFQANETLIDDVLKIVEKQDWENNSQNKVSIDDNFFHEDLFDWLEECIKKTAKLKLLLPEEVKLPITSCWVNKATKMQSHHDHAHPNSFLSGILYLTNNTDSQTVFHNPESMWLNNFKWASALQNVPVLHEISYTPSKGTLLLFPSQLKHKVKVMRNNEVRYTLSFNTFITGNFDSDGSNRTRLNLYAESLRDRLKNET